MSLEAKRVRIRRQPPHEGGWLEKSQQVREGWSWRPEERGSEDSLNMEEAASKRANRSWKDESGGQRSEDQKTASTWREAASRRANRSWEDESGGQRSEDQKTASTWRRLPRREPGPGRMSLEAAVAVARLWIGLPADLRKKFSKIWKIQHFRNFTIYDGWNQFLFVHLFFSIRTRFLL
jgi:hypothetical protein